METPDNLSILHDCIPPGYQGPVDHFSISPLPLTGKQDADLEICRYNDLLAQASSAKYGKTSVPDKYGNDETTASYDPGSNWKTVKHTVDHTPSHCSDHKSEELSLHGDGAIKLITHDHRNHYNYSSTIETYRRNSDGSLRHDVYDDTTCGYGPHPTWMEGHIRSLARTIKMDGGVIEEKKPSNWEEVAADGN